MSLPPREFTTEEAVAIESDRWRRVVAAFLIGMQARPEHGALDPWRGLVLAVCVAAAAVLVVGVVALASASLASGGAATVPKPTHAATVASASP